jgi:hypothetical protein
MQNSVVVRIVAVAVALLSASCAARQQQAVVQVGNTVLTHATFVADANDIVLDQVEALVKEGTLPPPQAAAVVTVLQQVAKHGQVLARAIEAAATVADPATQQAALNTARTILRDVQVALLDFLGGVTSEENKERLRQAVAPLFDAIVSTAAAVNR